MTTYRKLYGGLWTEAHRRIGDAVKVTSCCCAAPCATRKGCSIVAGNKTPCRCWCHSNDLDPYVKAKEKQ